MRENEIIERIKELCESRSWSFYRLSKESGITYSTLCTMLHKSNSPSIPTLIKICDGFGISLSQFFDKDDERAGLTEQQKKLLSLWDNLSDDNRLTAERHIQFLLSEQSDKK